jgi:hypothetical protein
MVEKAQSSIADRVSSFLCGNGGLSAACCVQPNSKGSEAIEDTIAAVIVRT